MDDLFDREEDYITILAIDPGTITLGFAVYKLDIVTLEIKDVFAWTIDATRLSYFDPMIIDIHGEKFARIMAIKRNFKGVLECYKPLAIVCETPFFNMRRPSAAGPLYELFATLEQTVYEWDNFKPLYKVDPKTAKKAVKAAHNAKKEDIRAALKKIPELDIANIDLLDEHSNDALAVGYFKVTELRNKGVKS